MFIYIQKGILFYFILFYFNSAANPIPNEIQELVDLILHQSVLLKIPMKYYTNYPK